MPSPFRALPMLLCHAALLACAASGVAHPAPPTGGYTGLFFHSFTGSEEGSEWATWGDRPGEGRYEFSDLSAQGHYAGTIDTDGAILFDNGAGAGQFLSDDEADIHFTLGGGLTFESHIRRAPYTDSSFPVFLNSTVAGDASLGGAWTAHVFDVDPATGATLAEQEATWNVDVSGTTVRLTRPDGEYVQGVWASEAQAAFRVISPPPRVQRYRTFVGSETSLDLDTVGDLRVLGPDSMTLAAFFQTRDPLGEQIQTMQYVELSRVPGPGVAAPFLLGALAAGVRRRRLGSGRPMPRGQFEARPSGAIGFALVALCATAHAGPVLVDDFESYDVGGLPGAPWEDIADSILHPTLPAPTGQIISTLGRDGGATQAYQIFQERGTSQGIITSILAADHPRVGADLRVDIHPSPKRYNNWTAALGFFQDVGAPDINGNPQAVVYVYDERWYFFGATDPNTNFVNERLDEAPVLAGAWYHVDLAVDAAAGAFSIRVFDDGGLVIDRTVVLPDWDPGLGRYDRLAAFDGEYARAAVEPGQFTVDNLRYVPGPPSMGLIAVAILGASCRRRRGAGAFWSD